MNADAVREITNCILCLKVREFSGMISRDQEIPGPFVSFMLYLRFNEFVVSGVVEKHVFLSMQQDVRRFMKEGEPESIVGLSVQRKLDEGTMRAQPARHAADVSARDRGHEHKGDARFPAEGPQARFEL